MATAGRAKLPPPSPFLSAVFFPGPLLATMPLVIGGAEPSRAVAAELAAMGGEATPAPVADTSDSALQFMELLLPLDAPTPLRRAPVPRLLLSSSSASTSSSSVSIAARALVPPRPLPPPLPPPPPLSPLPLLPRLPSPMPPPALGSGGDGVPEWRHGLAGGDTAIVLSLPAASSRTAGACRAAS